MRSLRDSVGAAGGDRQTGNGQQTGNWQQAGAQQNGAIDLETVQAMLALTPEQRWQMLLERAGRARAAGTLNDADLAAFAERAKPFLSPEQYARLTEAIRLL